MAVAARAQAAPRLDPGRSTAALGRPTTVARPLRLSLAVRPAVRLEPPARLVAASALLRLRDVSVTFRGQKLLENVSWSVDSGDRVGLVGPNGAGKTTQLRILSGELDPESGTVERDPRGVKVGWLKQELEAEIEESDGVARGEVAGAGGSGAPGSLGDLAAETHALPSLPDLSRTVRQVLEEGLAERVLARDRLEEVTALLERGADERGRPLSDDALAALLDELADLSAEGGGVKDAGRDAGPGGVAGSPSSATSEALALRSLVDRQLAALGFSDRDAERALASFSGGWRMRAALGRALLADPDVLLLDEPTNHLDAPTIAWLEDFLCQLSPSKALVVVSHDRAFLDAVCTKTVEVDRRGVWEAPGGYSAFARAKRERLALAWDAWERKQAEMARLQRLATGGKSVSAAAAAKAAKELERLRDDREVVRPWQHRRHLLSFAEPRARGTVAVLAEGLEHGYEARGEERRGGEDASGEVVYGAWNEGGDESRSDAWSEGPEEARDPERGEGAFVAPHGVADGGLENLDDADGTLGDFETDDVWNFGIDVEGDDGDADAAPRARGRRSRRTPPLFAPPEPSESRLSRPASLSSASAPTRSMGVRSSLFAVGRLEVLRGERVALVGPNGVGKSTLLRILAGLERPRRGEVRPGPAGVAMVAQDQADALDGRLTAEETLKRAAAKAWGEAFGGDGGGGGDRGGEDGPFGDGDASRAPDGPPTPYDLKSLLAKVGLSSATFDRPVSALSGGEKARLALACAAISRAGLLVLDEPTNHLDMPTKEALEGALQRFRGAVLFASHDRRFVAAVATRVLALEGNGRLRDHPGGWDDYLDAHPAAKRAWERTRAALDAEEKAAARVSKARVSRAERTLVAKGKGDRLEVAGLQAATRAGAAGKGKKKGKKNKRR